MSQAKKAKSKYSIKHGDTGNSAEDIDAKIDETDEMKLKLLANANTEDLLYPAELNSHFIEQLKVLSCENSELRKCIFGKDQEIKEQTKTITNLNQRIRDIISGPGPAISSKSAGVISAKISELCKTNRNLISELETYKTKNSILERKITQTELYYKDLNNLEGCACNVDVINVVEAAPNELNELKEKISIVTKKLYECKNKNLDLKNEILMANKILQQEVGEKFTSIRELQSGTSGFKGRAQQIILLNAKIIELEDKMNIKNKERNLFEEKRREQNNQIIRELEIKKKKEIDEAMRDFGRLKDELLETKKKLEGARARIRILECDVTILRQKIHTLVEKSNHDDLLVAEQKKQMKASELHYQEMLRDSLTKVNKLRNMSEDAQKEIKNFDHKIEAMRSQVTEKAGKIDELKRQLRRYEESSLQSVFFTPMKTATDNEIKTLTELIKNLNSRLSNTRQKLDELENSNRKLRESKRRMTKKVSELELQNDAFKEIKTKTMSRTSLLKRDSSAIKKSMSSSSIRPKTLSCIECKCSDEISDEFKTDILCYGNLDKEDLKNKLELAHERLKIMDDKVKMLEEEKEEDLQHLTGMIQTSKELFNDALCVLQKEKCICPMKVH